MTPSACRCAPAAADARLRARGNMRACHTDASNPARLLMLLHTRVAAEAGAAERDDAAAEGEDARIPV